MYYPKLLTIIFLIINTLCYSQSVSVSGRVNSRIGRGIQFNNLNEKTDFEYNEILADINISWSKYSSWVQYEYSNPPEYGRSINKIRRINLAYSNQNMNVEIGDIYRSWDRGLILSQFEDQQINFDNSIRGAGILFNGENFDFDIIGGFREQYQSTPFNTDLRKHDEIVSHKMIASRASFNIGGILNSITLFASNTEFPLISRGSTTNEESNVKNLIGGYSLQYNKPSWDIAFDAVVKNAKIEPKLYFIETDFTDFSIDSIPRENQNGYSLYTIINKYVGNWAFTFNYKKYHLAVMDPSKHISYPYPEGGIIYQNPPLTFYEHSSTLLNRNIHQLDKNDEVGYQMMLTGVINNNIDVLLNLSKGSRNASWKRGIGEFVWQKSVWKKDDEAYFIPLNNPAANPYFELYGEANSYFLNDKLLTKVGLSKSSQDLLLFENIVSDNYDSLSYEFVNALTIPINLGWAFSNGFSIDLKYQWQQLEKGIRSEVTNFDREGVNQTSFYFEDDAGVSKSKKYQNVSIVQIGIQKSPNWGINFTVEKEKFHEFGSNSKNLEINPLENFWEELGFETDLTWLSVEILANIASKYRFSIFYGSEKGGLQCRNGVCKVIQPFSDGFRVSLATYF